MSSPVSPQKAIQARPRRARLVLRDGAVVECGVYLNDGQALAPYLGSRKGGWVNVVDALWVAAGERHNHAVLQADHILIAASIENDFPIQVVTAGTTARDVDITLEDGSIVHGGLLLAEKQRLSDFLTAAGKFLPVVDATREPGAASASDIALNCTAVRVIHDTKVFAPGSMDLQPDAVVDAAPAPRPSAAAPVARPSTSVSVARPSMAAPTPPAARQTLSVPGGRPSGPAPPVSSTPSPSLRPPAGTPPVRPAVPASPPPAAIPVNREVVRRASGEIQVITEGRLPDRRIGRPYTPPVAAAPAPAAPALPPTPEQLRTSALIARHWLVSLAVRGQLLPPDPAGLSADPSLDEIWHGIAARNEMADGELAVRVAAAFKLSVANLNEASPEALKAIPEKVARKLSVLPLRVDGRRLVLAISDPTSMEIEQHVGFVTRLRLEYEVAPPADILGAIDWYYDTSAPSES